MNYVVVDFEWNQSMRGGHLRRLIPFEIVEIGAVMLDDSMKVIDSFSRTVKPRVYPKLHYITRDLTGITQKDLDESDPFPYVLVDFMLWCGDDFTFCTWGNADLVELQRNMNYYHLDDLLEGPIRYYNVQKLFRMQTGSENTSPALEQALDELGIEKDAPFHRAVNDADYTAKVLAKLDPVECEKNFSIDYYQNP